MPTRDVRCWHEAADDGRAEHVRSARLDQTLDINLFRYRERVVYLDPKIAHRALDFRVTKQELDGPKVAGTSVDQGRLGSA